MIETGYFAKIKDYPETDYLVCVSRKYPWFVKKDKMEHSKHIAPSEELLKDWKTEEIDWEQYETLYRRELTLYTTTIREIRYLRSWVDREETLRLMCWERDPPCHRFILKNILVEAEQR